MAKASDWQTQRALRIADGFRQALGDLGDVTADTPISFEGGSYRRLLLQPAHKLATALVTTREILVLVCPFTEVQTRTIRAASQELLRSATRLEPGMVVLLHDDPDGDDRLREWGREQGITVLPVLSSPRVPRDNDLEEALCSALYAHDPFDLAGPVRAAHQFYGRSEVPDLARRLRAGHIQSIFGIRKIGKTSVLNRLLTEASEFHGMACAFVDCSDDAVSQLDAGRLLYSVGGAVVDALDHSTSHYANLIPLDTTIAPDEAARILLNHLSSASRPLLLAFDEIDYISPSSPVAPHWASEFNKFFRALRHVYQECARRGIEFSIVIAGVSSRWFSVEQIDGIENSALALVPEAYLPPFTRAQSIEMIQTLGRSAGLGFGDKAAGLIAATCSDIPFWMRKAGSYINSCFDHESRPTKVGVPITKELCDEFIQVEGAQLAFSSFRHLFRIYPELAAPALACLSGGDPLTPQPILSALGRYGLLGDGLSPSGPMVAAGLRLFDDTDKEAQRTAPEQPTRLAVEAGSMSAAGEEQWAELLGEVSRRRNVVERSLREFILAVLRVDAQTRQDGKKAIDLLKSALPAGRREGAPNSITSLASSLFWSDLVLVVRKNWAAFAPYFGDLKQLELQADIINDRPDAHAKDFDGADLALQRRALNWIESSIERAGVL